MPNECSKTVSVSGRRGTLRERNQESATFWEAVATQVVLQARFGFIRPGRSRLTGAVWAIPW